MADEFAEFNLLPEIIEGIKKAADQAVRKAAFNIQAAAMDNVPVKSGFLKSSIYTVTSQGSIYGQAGTPPGDAYLLPEVDLLHDGSANAVVGVGANYGAFVEYGTAHGPAQPYLGPAMEMVAPSFELAMAALEEKLREVTGGL